MNIILVYIHALLGLAQLIKICDASLWSTPSKSSLNTTEKLVEARQKGLTFKDDDLSCRQRAEKYPTSSSSSSSSSCGYDGASKVSLYFRRRRKVSGELLLNIIEVGTQRTLRVEVTGDTLEVVLSTDDPDHNEGKLLVDSGGAHCTLSQNDKFRLSNIQNSVANKPAEDKEIFHFSLPLQEVDLDPIIHLVLPSSRDIQNLTLGVNSHKWTCGPIWRRKVRETRCLIVTPQESDIVCIDSKSSDFRPISDHGTLCLRNGICPIMNTSTGELSTHPCSHHIEIVTLLLVILLLLFLMGIIYAQIMLWMAIQCMREDFACLVNKESSHTLEPLHDIPKRLRKRFRKHTSSLTEKEEIPSSVNHHRSQILHKTSPCPPLLNGPKTSRHPGILERRNSGHHVGVPFPSSMETQSAESSEHEYDIVVPGDLKNAKNVHALLSSKGSISGEKHSCDASTSLKTSGFQDGATTGFQVPKKEATEVKPISSWDSQNSVYTERKQMEKNESVETVEM